MMMNMMRRRRIGRRIRRRKRKRQRRRMGENDHTSRIILNKGIFFNHTFHGIMYCMR